LNIEQQTWPEFTSMPDRRRCHSVCVLNNKLYVVGGFDVDDQLLDSGYRYDLQKNDWMILPNLTEKRANASLAVYAGSVFVLGGETSTRKRNAIVEPSISDSRQLLATVEVLDEKRKKWRKIGPDNKYGCLPNGTCQMAVCGATGHGIFLSGGENNEYEFAMIRFDDIDDNEKYGGGFSSIIRQHTTYVKLEPHKFAHVGHQMHWINGKLYLVDSSDVPSQGCEFYDIANKIWTQLIQFTPVSRSFTSSAALGDVIYLLGSSEEQNALTQSLQAFDTDGQDWLQMSGLPPSCKDFQLAVIRIPFTIE